jgi:hypothetical protein
MRVNRFSIGSRFIGMGMPNSFTQNNMSMIKESNTGIISGKNDQKKDYIKFF